MKNLPDLYVAPYCIPPGREERLNSVPVELDKITDAVLGYRPKNKAKQLRPKKRKKAK